MYAIDSTAIQHREFVNSTHYYEQLQAHDKTLNRFYHNDVMIEQKVSGYKIGPYNFLTLEQAKAFLDRRHAFEKFKLNFPGFPSMFENCLVYACPEGEHESRATKANEVIARLGLPLVAIATTYKTRDSFTVQTKEAK